MGIFNFENFCLFDSLYFKDISNNRFFIKCQEKKFSCFKDIIPYADYSYYLSLSSFGKNKYHLVSSCIDDYENQEMRNRLHLILKFLKKNNFEKTFDEFLVHFNPKSTEVEKYMLQKSCELGLYNKKFLTNRYLKRLVKKYFSNCRSTKAISDRKEILNLARKNDWSNIYLLQDEEKFEARLKNDKNTHPILNGVWRKIYSKNNIY